MSVLPPKTNRSSPIVWILPVAVGALLRTWVIWTNPHTILWDELHFHELAVKLAEGQPYGVPFWPPVWPYTLAALYRLFAPLPQAGLWFNGLLSVLTLILFLLFSKRLASRNTSLIGAWIMALMPSYLLANTLLIYEVLLQFLLLLALYLSFGVKWSWPRIAALAIVCAAIGLLRPTWAVLPVVFGVTHLFTLPARETRFRTGLFRIAAAQIGTVLLLIPWTAYASQQAGRFTPIALQGGLHLWMANNPQATGTHITPPGEFLDPRNDEVARRKALRYIARHPSHLVKILPAKLWYMFRGEAWSAWFAASTDPELSPRTVQWIAAASDALYYLVMVFCLAGIGLAVLQRWIEPLLLLIPFGYIVAAQVLLFTGQLKYRWPAQFILIFYSALALAWIADRLARQNPVEERMA